MSGKITHKELAKALGCAERTIERWSERDDWPKSGSLEDVRAFVEANGLGRGGTKTKTQLQEEKLRRDIKLADLKIAREEGQTVAVADVREFLAQISAKHSQLLRTKYDTELPAKLQGKDIVGIRRAIISTTDEVADVVNDGLLAWTPKP